MAGFYGRGTSIFNDFMTGNIVFSTDTPTRGIGISQIVTHNGLCSMMTNWDLGYYTANDFAKTFHVKITGTRDGNAIGQARFSVSDDDGVSYWTSDYVTGTTWISIISGIQIRFQPLVGTGNQCEYGDEWKFDCIPVNEYAAGGDLTFQTFKRG
jgi:hypothetical protein